MTVTGPESSRAAVRSMRSMRGVFVFRNAAQLLNNHHGHGHGHGHCHGITQYISAHMKVCAFFDDASMCPRDSFGHDSLITCRAM